MKMNLIYSIIQNIFHCIYKRSYFHVVLDKQLMINNYEIKSSLNCLLFIYTLLAIVRFNPVDVAFRDKRITVYAFSFLKFSITFYLLFIFIEPVVIK